MAANPKGIQKKFNNLSVELEAGKSKKMGCGHSKENASEPESQAAKEQRKAEEQSRKLYRNVMQHIPLLSGLSNMELTKLAEGMSSRTVQPGGYLMKEGDVGKEFFIVVKGKCEVTRTDESGNEEVLAYLENRDYVGEAALVADGDILRNASVKAIEKTICLVCDQATFRHVLSKSKVKFANRKNCRAAILTAINDVDEDLGDVDRTKDDAKIAFILKAVSTGPDGGNLMFQNLDEEQKIAVIKMMHREELKVGQSVIKQGDTNATKFYVVDTGSFSFHVDDQKIDYVGEAGSCFGELALMYDAPRAASVVANADAVVWVVNRQTFRKAIREMHKSNSRRNMEFLRSVELLKSLLSAELALIDAALEEKTYKKGTTLFKQGDKGSRFYIIKKGVVRWEKQCDGETEDGQLTQGQYFGELALLKNANRAATIVTDSDVVTLELARSDFVTLLGPLDEIMSGRAENAYKEVARQSLMNVNKVGALFAGMDIAGFTTLGFLGRGAFGFVTLVEAKGQTYALKAVKKCQIVETGQQAHIISEKKIMSMMNNAFLVNLIATFKDKLRVYFLLDVCLGGELFTILRQRRYFDEPTAQFYAACVVEGFDYMHSMDIIYRDLKPENMVMAANGYLKITDFGFAKIVPEKTYTLCGTPDYLAPEIVTGQGHGKGVDWWTFGVLIYEMLASFPPFFDDDPIQTYRKIIKGRIKYPRYFSSEAKDIVGNLLKLKPTRRLGVIKGGPENIRRHPWFKKFNWRAFTEQKLAPPIKPKIKDSRDLSNFNRRNEKDDDAKPIAPEDEFDKDF